MIPSRFLILKSLEQTNWQTKQFSVVVSVDVLNTCAVLSSIPTTVTTYIYYIMITILLLFSSDTVGCCWHS